MRASRPAHCLWAFTAMAGLVTSVGACGGNGDGDSTSAGPSETDPPVSAVIDPGDGGDYRPDVGPSDFVAAVDNPYLPLRPGARWAYEGVVDGEPERVEVVVTDRTREVMGVRAIVVQDTALVGGEVVEDTEDWYAQDRAGNVWYFGEATTSYDGETPSDEGSWEAGVGGALPGIVMPASPEVGAAYRQEYLPNEAEDMGEVIAVGEEVEVPAGRYEDVVATRDWTPLEPETVEEKRYAPGIGLVREVTTDGGTGGLDLVEYVPAP